MPFDILNANNVGIAFPTKKPPDDVAVEVLADRESEHAGLTMTG
jgi:hypothetical protein